VAQGGKKSRKKYKAPDLRTEGKELRESRQFGGTVAQANSSQDQTKKKSIIGGESGEVVESTGDDWVQGWKKVRQGLSRSPRTYKENR